MHNTEVVEGLGYTLKIVNQTYNRASVISGGFSGTRQQVRAHFPFSLFVHCFTHALKPILIWETLHWAGAGWLLFHFSFRALHLMQLTMDAAHGYHLVEFQ